ncbi:MAG: hypothetical protein SNJ77_02250 [Cytophagales bacterium]
MIKSLKYVWLIWLFCGFCSVIKGQEANSKVAFSNINFDLLNDLVLQRVNYIRDTLGVRKLENDALLAKASDHHAKYLVKLGQLSSTQTNKKTENVEDRVNLFKGNYSQLGQFQSSTFVGKNVLLKKENRKVIYETYADVADGLVKDLFQGSVNQTTKYMKLLENNEFSNIGIAFGLDEPSKKIYSVFVLGNKPYIAPAGVPISENAFGIMPYDDSKCSMCKNAFKTKPSNTSILAVIEDGKIVLKTNNAVFLKDLINTSIDAISVDLIEQGQFDCKNPNVLHKSEIHDGVLLSPIKKKTLLKNFREGEKNEAEIFLGLVPNAFAEKKIEANLLFLKSKSLCSYNRYVAKTIDSLGLLHNGYFIDTIHPSNQVYHADNPHKLKHVLYYKNNQTHFESNEISLLTNLLDKKVFDIKDIKFVVYHPVTKGDSVSISQNDKLIKNLVDFLQKMQPDTIKYTINHIPAWLQLYEDLDKTSFKNLIDLPRKNVVEMLKTNFELGKIYSGLTDKHQKIVMFISTQIERDSKAKTKEDFLDEINSCFDKDDGLKLLEIQKELFNAVQFGEISIDFVDEIKIPRKTVFAEAINNQTAFLMFHEKEKATYAFDELNKANELKKGVPKYVYNMVSANVQKVYDNIQQTKDVSFLETDIQGLTVYNLDRKLILKLNANFHFLKAEIFKRMNQTKKMEGVLDKLPGLINPGELSDEDLLTLINTLSYFGSNQMIDQLLAPIVPTDMAEEELVFKYLEKTLSNKNSVSSPHYPLVLENAFSLNPRKLCSMFSSEFGSFQYLDFQTLKKFYCKSCMSDN